MYNVSDFSFNSDFLEDQFMLFEIPDPMLDRILKGESHAEFVTNKKDPIVLAVDNKTYDVLEFDTSNQLLPYLGDSIITQNSSTFELRRTQPPFLSFRRMMKENPLTLAQLGGEEIEKPFNFFQLVDNTLCSVTEVESMLTKLCAIRIGDNVAVPANDLRDRVIDNIIRRAFTKDDWRRVNVQDMIKSIDFAVILMVDPIDEEKATENITNLIKSVILYLSESYTEETAILDDKKVVKHIIKEFMKDERDSFMHGKDFEEKATGLIPADIKLQEMYIHGICCHSGDGYKYIDEELLPIQVVQRFEALFNIQKKWKESELEPFFEDFTTDELTFNTLANRYARFADNLWMPR